jgi:hypothetical protein
MKFPGVTPSEILHSQTGIDAILSNVSGIAMKLYLKSHISDNCQITQFGQYNPIHDKHKRPRALFTD